MSMPSLYPYNWLKLDMDETRFSHVGSEIKHLTLQNLYLGDYLVMRSSSQAKWRLSNLNQVIYSFKRPVNALDTYKEDALHELSNALTHLLLNDLKTDINRVALVPMPPSTSKQSPSYDSRMLRLCNDVSRRTNVATIDLLETIEDRTPNHTRVQRNTPEQIENNLYIHSDLDINYTYLFIIDDVITQGNHLLAASRKIKSAYPDKSIVGIFFGKSLYYD